MACDPRQWLGRWFVGRGSVIAAGLALFAAGAVAGERPRVLILGDSISIGYTPHVQELLKDEAEVVRPMRPNGKPENCSGTTFGVAEVDRWLAIGGGTWDVIHFNFGLHDLKRVDAKTGAASGDPAGPRQAEPEAYEANLRRIVERLKASDAGLVFATTTPVPEGKLSPHRVPADVERYNAIARRVMEENGIVVDDLYGIALPKLAEIQRPANVHFTPDGSKALAEQVAASIRERLVKPGEDRKASRRPNILFFLSDDQRAGFLSCAGHPIVRTPAIDRLAADGMRFENAFVTTPICAASRATILTGVVERTHKFTFRTPPVSEEFCDTSYPALLHAEGYRTGHIGKFGVGVPRAKQDEMFDVFHPLNGTPYFKKQPDGSERYVEEIAGDLAVEFLKAEDDRPFFLQVCFNAPHAADGQFENLYPHPPGVAGLYQETAIPAPPFSEPEVFEGLPEFLRTSIGRERWYWQFDTPEKYEKNVRDYYRMISGIDGVIGRVMGELEKLGADEETVVVFSSDNGYLIGERGLSGKWVHYEESLRVPLVVRDPRPGAKHGETNAATVLNLDIPATILDYAGVDRPAVYQGRSLRPLVEGETPRGWRTDFYCEHLMEHEKIPRWEGARTERFTYARYFEQSPVYEFLHDRTADPSQLTNFATDPAYADELERLRARTTELRDSHGGEYSKEKYPVAEKPPSLDGG